MWLCLGLGCGHLWEPIVLPIGGFPGGSVVKNPSANVGDTGDAGLIPGPGRWLEKEMATHSNIHAWKVPWREEPMGSQRVRHNWVTEHAHEHTHMQTYTISFLRTHPMSNKSGEGSWQRSDASSEDAETTVTIRDSESFQILRKYLKNSLWHI